MLSYMQKIGRSLMVPVAVLPAAALLMGVGYWIDPIGWGGDNLAAAILIQAGKALIDNMGILFAVGVGFGLSKDNHGAAALTALVGWLIVQTMLSPDSIALFKTIEVSDVNSAFGKINNQFIGILVGVISSIVYNKTYQVKLNPALSFFAGRRLSSIINSIVMVCLSLILLLIWPVIFEALITFGESIISLDAIGAGLFGFFNRLLIPLGLHHALNSVFWFDVAGINDITNYLSGVGTPGVTGIYQAGFFPIMMFGLPAASLAMYQEAQPSQRKKIGGLLLSGAIASFFTGVTEPLEFSFMFVAPLLYFMHAVFTGISLFIAAKFQWIAGFGFSAGFVDYILSFKNPLAVNNLFLLLQGVGFALLYYLTFRFTIRKFNILTPGRDVEVDEIQDIAPNNNYTQKAQNLLDVIGIENIVEITNCTTRLRLTVKDSSIYPDRDFKRLGIIGVVKPSSTSLQLVVGPDVEFLSVEMQNIYQKTNS